MGCYYRFFYIKMEKKELYEKLIELKVLINNHKYLKTKNKIDDIIFTLATE